MHIVPGHNLNPHTSVHCSVLHGRPLSTSYYAEVELNWYDATRKVQSAVEMP